MQAATKHYVECTGRHITTDQRRYIDRPAGIAIQSRIRAASGTEAVHVDSQIAYALPLAGGTLSGALILPGDPTTALQAATKRYVDSSAFYSVTSLAPVTTIAGSDLVAISQGGTDHSISYANLLDGMTIDVASTAAPASDTDLFWVGQGSSTMLAQTFATVWTWIKGKLPTYRRPVVEISINTTLDGTIHNGAILVCSQPITLTPAFPNMGSGFTCSVVNLSGGNVTFGVGIVTSSGTPTLPTGQAAELRAFTYSSGNVVFAAIAGGALAQPPGQVTGLAVGVATPSSVALTWQAPATGRRGNWLHGQLSGDFARRCLDIAECRRNKPDRQRPCGSDAIRLHGDRQQRGRQRRGIVGGDRHNAGRTDTATRPGHRTGGQQSDCQHGRSRMDRAKHWRRGGKLHGAISHDWRHGLECRGERRSHDGLHRDRPRRIDRL